MSIVYASTRQQYGRPHYLPVDENHLLQPIDVNGINKMAGEWYHILYANVYGIRATRLRLTNTYGPGMLLKHDRQGFIPWFVRKVLLDEEIEVFGNGDQRRDMNYVDDVTRAFLLVGATDAANGEIYNLGGSEVVSLLDFVEDADRASRGRGATGSSPFRRRASGSTSATTTAATTRSGRPSAGNRGSRCATALLGRSTTTARTPRTT